MDEIAEKGFAAHWKYKIGEGEEESELDAWLKTIKDILDNPEPSAIDFLDTVKLNLFSSEIVVFTPKGELLTLPSGATVLDAAFALHSEIGMHCIAGKVNHKLMPLSAKLNSGDQVEILTSQSQQPQAEWAGFLVTAHARTRLRAALRKMRQPLTARGAEILREWLSEHNIPDTNAVISKILGTYHVPNRDELCYQLGNEEIMLGDFLVKALRKPAQAGAKPQGIIGKILGIGKKKADDKDAAPGTVNTKETYVLRSGDSGPENYLTAPCCSPIPGDDALGYITESGEIEVHSLDCPRAQVLKAGYGPRIVAVKWANAGAKFMAHVHIEGIDRHGILQELIQMISTHLAIDIRKLEIEAKAQVFNCDLWVRVVSLDVLNDLCAKTLTIDGVTSATRIQ